MAEKQALKWDDFQCEGCTATWAADRSSVTLEFAPEGGRIIWSGPTGRVGGREWGKARYFGYDFTGLEEWSILTNMLFWLEGNDTPVPDMLVSMGTLPRVPVRLALPLQALDSQSIFLPRTPGRLKTGIRNNKIDVTRINRVGIAIPPCFARQKVTISNLFLSVEEPDYPVPDEKLVDEFGQWNRRDWFGKTYSEKQLVDYLRAEETRPEGSFPADWNGYGGWKELRFPATGFFRTEHDGKRWWLVDPEGCAFHSVGLDCCNPGEPAWVEGIQKLFSWLPPEDGEYGPFWSKAGAARGMWHFRGRLSPEARFFNYGAANLKRAFGDQWYEKWAAITRRRLIDWNVNTIGNWSDLRFIRLARMPYVWPLVDFPTTQTRVFRDFPDVYSSEFRANSEAFARQLEELVGDPYMIGYFLRNEPTWAFVRGLNIAEEVLENPAPLACREALIRFLAERYGGDVSRLNAAWNLHLDSFQGLQAPLSRATRLSDAARQDLLDFSRLMIEQYVKVPSDACRRVDPQHMNLGLRWAAVHDPILITGYEHFDVFSINCYQPSPLQAIEEVGKLTGKPVMVGEFHFGALDRGLVSTGLRGVTSQSERGFAWRYYAEMGATSSYSVGTHYFILNDQACLGRLDGENYQIGVVDVCHKPYEEFVRGIRETNRTIYQVAAGRVVANPPLPVETGRVG